MPSQVSIKKVQGLLVELTNKQSFVDSLKPANEGAEPVIKISVERLTLTLTVDENSEAYRMLVNALSTIIDKDIERLLGDIDKLLNN